MTQEEQRDALRERLCTIGQDHVLAFWDQLDETCRGALLDDLEAVPYELLARVRGGGVAALEPEVPELGRLSPVRVVDPEAGGLELEHARELGVQALRVGQVAAVTVAGGQGSRLGFDGPKGTYPIGPISGHSFFQILADAVLGAGQKYGAPIPWYVMTSDATHSATEAYFHDNNEFGLAPGQLRLFRQGAWPALSMDGKMLLSEKHRLALSPDGHGGLVDALARSGSLARMCREGTLHLSVFQVDNPLVRWFDPMFLGLHVLRGSDISCKAISKRDDHEGLGNFCLQDGKTRCIEYSDFPDAHACAKNPDGSRRFDAGNLSIYVMGVDFLDRLVRTRAGLPIHLARKKVPYLDQATGKRIEPVEPNAIKMEKFVFDVLPHARHVSIVKTRREEEFGPVKTLRGQDSVESCRGAMVQRACRWLAQAGVEVPVGRDGTFDAWLELSSRVQTPEDLAGREDLPRRVSPGQRLYFS